MKNYGNMHNMLKDRSLMIPARMFRILLLVSFLTLPLQTYCAPVSAEVLLQKGDSCRYVWKYKKALRYYQQSYDISATKKDVKLQLQLLERIMRTHDVLRHWRDMPESSYRLYNLAREYGDSAHMALALFIRGKRMLALDQKTEGVKACLDALEMMKRTQFEHKNYEISIFYGVLAKFYCNAGNYEEALHMSDEQARYTELAKDADADKWYERNLRCANTIRMEILAKLGRVAEADSIYKRYGMRYDANPICGNALLNYFRLRGMNGEAMEFITSAMQTMREDGDTVGRNMQRVLNDMGDIYYDMGDYKKAAECYSGMTDIADTLAVNALSNLSNEIQKVIDNERAIASHNKTMTVIIALVTLLVAIIFLILLQAWMMRRRNQKMTALIQQMMHYRNIVIQNGDAVETEKNVRSNVSEEDMRRFKAVDKRIMKERLFTSPSFGREDLMRLLGVDKNALPTLLQNITGTNVPGYINIKRMEYAVFLMKEHPEYTISAIAEACGISGASTFIRNFREIYDMTPSEYRKQLTTAASTPPILTLDNIDGKSDKLK